MLGRMHSLPQESLVEMGQKIKQNDPLSFHPVGNVIGLNSSLDCERAEEDVLIGEG